MPQLAAEVARDAGVATAEYLLAHRIPKPVQALLRVLPAPLGLSRPARRHPPPCLDVCRQRPLRGDCRAPALLTIRNNPLCRGQHSAVPVCDYYAATFEHLFRTLVHADTLRARS